MRGNKQHEVTRRSHVQVSHRSESSYQTPGVTSCWQHEVTSRSHVQVSHRSESSYQTPGVTSYWSYVEVNSTFLTHDKVTIKY